MVRSPGHGVSPEPVPVQPRSARIRLIFVYLRFRLLSCFAEAGIGAGVAHGTWYWSEHHDGASALTSCVLRKRKWKHRCTPIRRDNADGALARPRGLM
jgi:hypothetical protein